MILEFYINSARKDGLNLFILLKYKNCNISNTVDDEITMMTLW